MPGVSHNIGLSGIFIVILGNMLCSIVKTRVPRTHLEPPWDSSILK